MEKTRLKKDKFLYIKIEQLVFEFSVKSATTIIFYFDSAKQKTSNNK